MNNVIYLPFGLVVAAPESIPAPAPSITPAPRDSSLVRIFNAGLTAGPNEPLPVQGHFSSSATFWLTSPRQPTAVQIKPYTNGTTTIKEANAAILKIPASLAYEEYKVWVRENGVDYAPVYVNRAQPLFATAYFVNAGGQLVLCGRNLQLKEGRSKVWFTPAGGGASLQGTVDATQSNIYYLKCQCPAGLKTGTRYTVAVSTGYGNNHRAALPLPVTCLPAGKDSFRLGGRVPFASQLNYGGNVYNIKSDSRLPLKSQGDNTDCTEAVNAALAKASSAVVNGVRGGTVFLPAGIYKIGGNGIVIPDYACLQGERGTVMYVEGEANGVKYAFSSVNTTRAGMVNIYYENRNKPNLTSPWQNTFIQNTTEFFIKGGSFKLNDSVWMQLPDNKRLVLLDFYLSQCDLPNHEIRRGPIRIDNSTNVIVDNLDCDFAIDAFNAGHVTGLIQRVKMRWDGGLGNAQRVVNHVLVFGGSQNLMLYDNDFSATYANSFKDMVSKKTRGRGNATHANDNEGMLAERTGSEADNMSGQLTAVSTDGRTLTDASKNFSALPFPTTIYLVDGRGNGQTRRVLRLGAANNQLVLDAAFDVRPDTSTRYGICQWSVQNVLVVGNKFTDLKRGILLYYTASRDITIADNVLLNSGPIDITPKCMGDAGNYRVLVALRTYIRGNTIDSRTDKQQQGFVGMKPLYHIVNTPFGTLAYNTEIIDNTIHNRLPTQKCIIDEDFDNAGIYAAMVYHPMINWTPNNARPVLVNVVAYNNRVYNSHSMLRVGTGNLNVLSLNNRRLNTPAELHDKVLDGNKVGARNLVEVGTGTLSKP